VGGSGGVSLVHRRQIVLDRVIRGIANGNPGRRGHASMFPEKFHELEDKIRLLAELMAQLRQEKMQLEEKNHEAAQRIAELEGEIKHLRAERQPASSPVETLIQHLNARPGDAQEQALHRLTETLAKEPNNVKALFELGNAYERQGMYEQAIQEYRQALKADANFVDAIEHLAFLLEKLNRDNEASPLWERILSLKKHA
jgi:tetratricopeptide (TPR) repeat protein